MSAPDTVFFLSDYGLRDTFVGVVHAVLRRLAPACTVVDLTHEIAPFDVRGGGLALAQAVPHLGPGVVLGVVDPGVGGARRAVVAQGGDQWFVGPDNGLLVPVLDAVGAGTEPTVWALAHERASGDAATFDGRDVFAPAAAVICRGETTWGDDDRVDPSTLVRLPAPVVERDVPGHGDARVTLRAEVISLDRFGNVQLAARRGDLPAAMPGPLDDPARVRVTVTVSPRFAHPERSGRDATEVTWVTTFGDLERGELGLLVDSAGFLALAMAESSAAAELCVAAGDLIELSI